LLDEPVRSRDVSYLLDEAAADEQPRSLGRMLLLVFGLLLIGGFGYMYFLSGASWPGHKDAMKAAIPTAAPNEPPSGMSAVSSANNKSSRLAVPAAAPAATVENSAAPAPIPSVDASKADAGSPEGSSASAAPPKPAPAPAKATPKPATTAPPKSPATASLRPVKTKPIATEVLAKQTPLPAPRPTADLVAQAEKLVYGDGVPQDCDRGLGAMRPLATAADPKAMIALGALYTTGTCVPRDLPTAYSWYAKALRVNSDNMTLQQDMKQIWGQMTAPERQLAIRLSQ
jgi:hypothetical protein